MLKSDQGADHEGAISRRHRPATGPVARPSAANPDPRAAHRPRGEPERARQPARRRPQRRRVPHACARSLRRARARRHRAAPRRDRALLQGHPAAPSSVDRTGGRCRERSAAASPPRPCRPSSTRRSRRWKRAPSTAATTPSSAGCRCTSTRRASQEVVSILEEATKLMLAAHVRSQDRLSDSWRRGHRLDRGRHGGIRDGGVDSRRRSRERVPDTASSGIDLPSASLRRTCCALRAQTSDCMSPNIPPEGYRHPLTTALRQTPRGPAALTKDRQLSRAKLP